MHGVLLPLKELGDTGVAGSEGLIRVLGFRAQGFELYSLRG